jgi:hypothetical protein
MTFVCHRNPAGKKKPLVYQWLFLNNLFRDQYYEKQTKSQQVRFQ